METYKIDLIKIGRDDHSETFVRNCMTKELACQFAIDKAGKHLMSSDVMMDKINEDDVYTVFAGFRVVGRVRITKGNCEFKSKEKK